MKFLSMKYKIIQVFSFYFILAKSNKIDIQNEINILKANTSLIYDVPHDGNCMFHAVAQGIT